MKRLLVPGNTKNIDKDIVDEELDEEFEEEKWEIFAFMKNKKITFEFLYGNTNNTPFLTYEFGAEINYENNIESLGYYQISLDDLLFNCMGKVAHDSRNNIKKFHSIFPFLYIRKGRGIQVIYAKKIFPLHDLYQYFLEEAKKNIRFK